MTKRAVIITFVGILFLAVAFRLVGLDRSFVLDEFRTIKLANFGMPGLLEFIKGDSYPPFSYALLSCWLNISNNDVWIRLLFVMFGTMSVIMVYLIGKELIDPRYALIAMFLAAVMPMQVWVSQYVRGICPAIFFLLISTLFFLKLIRHEEEGSYYINALGYIFGTAMAIYSFYFAFFIILAQNAIYLIFNRNEFKRMLRWMLLQVIVAILFLPWVPAFLEQMKGANIISNFTVMNNTGFSVSRFQIGVYLRAISGSLGMDQSFLINTAVSKGLTMGMIPLLVLLLLTAAVFFIILLTKIYRNITKGDKLRTAKFSSKKIIAIFSTMGLIPIVLSVFLNISARTAVTPRYFAVSSVFALFLYALALFSFRDKKFFYSALVLFMLISLWRLSDFTKTVIDYKTSAVFIKERIKEEECLLFIGGDRAYEYYSGFPRNYIMGADYLRGYGIGSDYSLKHMVKADDLKVRLIPFRSVWIYNSAEQMTGSIQYVLGLIEGFGYKRIDQYKFKNIEIFRYEKMG